MTRGLVRGRRRGASALLLVAALAACRSTSPSAPDEPAPAGEPEAPTAPEPELTIGATFEGVTLRGRAGGNVEAATFDPACAGLVTEAPHHRIRVSTPAALTLHATPVGTGFMDLALVLRGPTGAWQCFDDSDTLDPVAALELEPGDWSVWVAALAAERPPYDLTIRPGIHTPEPLRMGSPLPPVIEDGTPAEPLDEGTYGGVRFGPGNAAARLEGEAGGPRNAVDLRYDCAGWIATAPDHVVEVTAAMEVGFVVSAPGDTTLVLRGPNDTLFCADDTDGLDPAIRQLVPAGRWEVHVGTWAAQERIPYVLRVTR